MQGFARCFLGTSKVVAKTAICVVAILCAGNPARGAVGLTFQVPFYVQTSSGGKIVTNRTFNTIAGPADHQRLFNGMRLAPSGIDGVYLGIDWSAVTRVNANGTATAEPTGGLALNDWPMSLAYDSQAHRAVLVTLGGEGAMYQRPAATQNWSRLASMQNEDLDSLVYRAADNSFWGLRVHSGGGGVPGILIHYSATGDRLGQISLPALSDDLWQSAHSELVAVEGMLVALVEPDRRSPLQPGARSRIYVINPETGTAEVSYESIPKAPSAPVVQFILPGNNTTIPLGQSVNIVITAFDADNDLRSVTLSDNGIVLKMWMFDPGPGGTNRLEMTWTPTVGDHVLIARATDVSGQVTDGTTRVLVANPNPYFAGWYWNRESIIGVDYRPNGPNDGGTLFRGIPVAQAGYRYLGKEGHSIWWIDNERDTVVETRPGPGLPELSWPRGAAFDSKRNRFVVPSLGGEGYLYAVTPATHEWSLIASMNNVDVDSIVYHMFDDRYYMVERLYGGGTLRVLRYTPEGLPAGEITIGEAPFDVGGGYRSHLIDANGKIALLIEPMPNWGQNPPIESRIYMIDPVANTAVMTYRHILNIWPPQPEPTMALTITNPTDGAEIAQGLVIPITARATNGLLAAVTFYADGIKLARVTGPFVTVGPPLFTFPWSNAPAGDHTLIAVGQLPVVGIDSSTTITSAPVRIRVIAREPRMTVQRDLPESYFAPNWVNVKLDARPTNGVVAWAVEEQPPAGWTFGQASHEGTFDPLSRKIKWGPFTDAQPRMLLYTIRPATNSIGVKNFSGVASANGVSVPITGDTTISDASPYHPADASPQDLRLTVNEVTAYAAAWKSGAIWPRGPSPIPLSYVTRAGFIWKSGEGYRFIQTLPPPACWEPVGMTGRVALAAMPLDSSSFATRTLSAAFSAGYAATVTVQIQPGAGVQSYGLEEKPPVGWTVVDAPGAAVLNGTVRFGPFFDGQERTFVYTVVPSSVTASSSFAGEVSFDGSSERVAGATAACPVGAFAEHRDGKVCLRINATAGEKFVLESAKAIDEVTWQFETTVTGGDTAVEIQPITPSAQQRFYRLRPVAQ